MSQNYTQLNNLFWQGLFQNDEGINKISAATGTYIKERIRERSFLDEIIPPETITAADLNQSSQHEEPTKIGFIQPNAEASIVNFDSKPDEKWISGERYDIVFKKIASPILQKNEAKLMTYGYNITQVIEDIVIKDMARVKDKSFIETCAAIVASTGLSAAAAAPMDRAAVNAGAKLLETDATADVQGVLGCVLVNKSDWNDWNEAQALDVGNDVASEMTKNGYGKDTIMGYKCLITNKSSIVPPNTMWFFSPPEYLGENYILSDVKFQIRKEWDLIKMMAWGYFGTGIGNIRGVAKVTLS